MGAEPRRGGNRLAEIPTFFSGEAIRLELELRDESGVGQVMGVFAHASPGAFSREDPTSGYEDIRLEGNGEGRAKATVIISGTVGREVASGEYVCKYVQAYDTQGNYRTFHPEAEIRFNVENGPRDREGPELSDWRFVEPGTRDRRSWWRGLFGE